MLKKILVGSGSGPDWEWPNQLPDRRERLFKGPALTDLKGGRQEELPSQGV